MSKKYKIKQDCHLCTAKSLQFHFVLKDNTDGENCYWSMKVIRNQGSMLYGPQ